MRYDPRVHHRRSIRLPSVDYRGAGAYFITLCTEKKIAILGDVESDDIRLSPAGEIVEYEWRRSAEIRAEVDLDEFVVMPNHFHAVVLLSANVGAQGLSPLRPDADRTPRVLPRSLGSLVRGFKSATTTRINKLGRTPGRPVWQRNYYERVLRNERELAEARRYIANNPRKWALDPNHPANAGTR